MNNNIISNEHAEDNDYSESAALNTITAVSDTTDDCNIYEYTSDEIADEMRVLSRSFDTVRLVNPCECRIVENSDNNSDNNITVSCFDVWNVPYQCVNCTSARAMLTKRTQSKLETTGDDIYQVTSRPVIVDKSPLVLEIVKHFSYTYNRYNSQSERTRLINSIKNLNSHLLLDKETNAYNRDYLSEHLPNLFYKAKQTNQTNAALIHIQNLYDITKKEGSMAASGIICSLYSMLRQLFCDETDVGLLFVRYNPDTFFVLENNLDYDSFIKRMEQLPLQVAPEHLLFNNKRLPFSISMAFADIGHEDIDNEQDLFSILKERIQDNV